MSSQSFEYELVLRVMQAEQQIERVAGRISSAFESAAAQATASADRAAQHWQNIQINTARIIGSERMAEEDRLSNAILNIQINTANRVGREWSQMYDRVAAHARMSLGGGASNAGWFRSQDRLEEIRQLGAEFRRQFANPGFAPMIEQLERSLRSSSGSLNRLNDPEREFQQWTATRDARLQAFQREAQELQDLLDLTNQIHNTRMSQNNAEAAAVAQQMSRESAAHDQMMQDLAAEYASILRNSAAAKDAADRTAVGYGTTAVELKKKDVVYPERDLIQMIAQDKLDMIQKEAEAQKIKDKADHDAAVKKRELDKQNHAAKLAEDAEYVSRAEANHAQIKADEEKQEARRKQARDAFVRDGLAATDKQIASNDKMYSRLMTNSQNAQAADAVRYAAMRRLDEAFTDAHRQNQQELMALEAKRADMGEQEFRRALQREQQLGKARLDAAGKTGWDAHNADLSAFAGGGRAVSNMFQIQQAFEDAQYAGLRGAANNIAMMAANMGGSGGIIALGAIMGAQAATSLGLWDSLNESLNGFLWKLKSVTEEEEKQIKLTMQMFDLRKADAEQIAKFGPGDSKGLDKKIAENKASVDNTARWAAQYERAASAYKSMEGTAKALDTLMPRGWTLNIGSSPEESNQMLDFYKQVVEEGVLLTGAQREYADELIRSFEAAKKLYEENAAGAPITEKAAEEIKKKYEEATEALAKFNSELKTNQFLKESMTSIDKSHKEAMSDAFKADAAFEGAGLKGEAKSQFKEVTESLQRYVDALQEQTKVKMELAQASAAAELAAAREAGDYDKVAKILKELATTQAEYAKQVKEASDSAIFSARQEESIAREKQENLERLTEFQKGITKDWQEQVSLGEQQLNNLNQLIQADEQRLRVMEDQVSAFEDAKAKQAVGLQAKQVEHEGKLEVEAYKERARLGKEAFQKWADNQKEMLRQAEKMETLTNAKGKGDANPDHMVREKYARMRHQLDEYVKDATNRNEAADRHNLKRIERQAELEVKAKYKEYSDAQKVKEDQLRTEAQDAESGGDLIKADQKRKQLDKILKERADAAAQQVGQGTKEEGRKAYEEWQTYNDKIVANEKAHAEVIKARQEQNIGHANTLSVHVENMKAAMEEISQLTIGSDDTEARLQGYLETLNMMKEAMAETARLSSLINPGGGGPGRPLPGGTPAYAEGTDYVPETGLALIHKGEMIIPASQAAKIRAAQQTDFHTPTDISTISSARRAYNDGMRTGTATYNSARSGLISARNSGNTFAVDQLEGLSREFEKWQSTMEKINKEISKAEEEVKQQAKERRSQAENARSEAALSEIRERRSKEALDRAESAQRIRKLEEERQANLDRLNNGPESTPDYIARRRKEIAARERQASVDFFDGRKNVEKLPGFGGWHKGSDPSMPYGVEGSTGPARAAAELNSKISDVALGYTDLQSRIVDEIEKTHEMVKEAKGKVTDAGHEREKMHQKKKAGLDLENQGWKQKGGGDGGSFRTGDGEYISPEHQALNDRLDGERRRAEQLKRARRLSGQTPSQVEQGDVQDAMKLEQQLERSAAQKRMLEAMEAVKAAEVTQANELAAALERAAAAKELLSKAGSGGYGVSGSGLGMGGSAGGAMGGMAGGGGGMSGQSVVVNNTMNATMAPASPASVFAAMSAAAQINSIRRR